MRESLFPDREQNFPVMIFRELREKMWLIHGVLASDPLRIASYRCYLQSGGKRELRAEWGVDCADCAPERASLDGILWLRQNFSPGETKMVRFSTRPRRAGGVGLAEFSMDGSECPGRSA